MKHGHSHTLAYLGRISLPNRYSGTSSLVIESSTGTRRSSGITA